MQMAENINSYRVFVGKLGKQKLRVRIILK
jgi:hypothetical protein